MEKIDNKSDLFFLCCKKNDFFGRKELSKITFVKKIKFLKTVFDDIENY